MFPSLSEFSTVYCDPHNQRLIDTIFDGKEELGLKQIRVKEGRMTTVCTSLT